jgi:hypothetical protein
MMPLLLCAGTSGRRHTSNTAAAQSHVTSAPLLVLLGKGKPTAQCLSTMQPKKAEEACIMQLQFGLQG